MRLGPKFDAIREKIEELRFTPKSEPVWPRARTGEQINLTIPFAWDKARGNKYIAGVLNQLKDLLIIASERFREEQHTPKTRIHRTQRAKQAERKWNGINITPPQFRAKVVAMVFRELSIIRPDMYGESDFENLAKKHPRFITFQVTKQNDKLRTLLVNIQAHRRYIRLAQEIAAVRTGVALNTIQIDWKKHKPPEFRRKRPN